MKNSDIRCIYIPIIGKPLIISIPRAKFNHTVCRMINCDTYDIAPVNGAVNYQLIVDDDGLPRDKPINPLASFLYASDGMHVIVGTAILVNTGLVDGEPDVISIPAESAEPLLDMLLDFRRHYTTICELMHGGDDA